MRFELAPFDLPAGYGDGIVSVDDLKDHLSLTGVNEFDGLLAVLRDAAIDQVERYCGVRLGNAEDVEWKAEQLGDCFHLGVWPVTAITAVTWLGSDGSNVTGDAAIWRTTVRDEVRLKPGASLPSGIEAGVTVTFNAGFTDANRPAALVHAVKMFAAHLFANREAVITGTISGEIPLGFKSLCASYRMPLI